MTEAAFKERLFNQLKGEVCFAKGYQMNIDKALDCLRDAEDRDGVMAQARTIAFNKGMLRTHLERAAAILELMEAFSPDEDSVDLATIESKTTSLKSDMGLV